MIKLPGTIGTAEAKKNLMAQVVAQHFAMATAQAQPAPTATEQKVRRPMPGDVGRPLNARLP